MSKKTLNDINNELKIYINEASGISEKCKQKLVKLVEKHFYVDLPNDNYLNIDITILENGNVIMREEEYQTTKKINSKEDIYERYENFQIEIKDLLEKNEIDFESKKRNSELLNLLIVLITIIISIIILIYSVKVLLRKDLFGLLWIVFILGYYIVPATGNNLRNRFIRAKKYLKKFTKK